MPHRVPHDSDSRSETAQIIGLRNEFGEHQSGYLSGPGSIDVFSFAGPGLKAGPSIFWVL